MTQAEAYQRQIFAGRAKRAEEEAAFSAVKPVLKVAGVPIGLQTGNNQLEKQADHEQLRKIDAPVVSLALRGVQRRIERVGAAVLEKHFGRRKVLGTEQHVTAGGPLQKAATLSATGTLPAAPVRPLDRFGVRSAPARPQPPPFAGQGLSGDAEFMALMREAIANGRTIGAGESVLLRGRQVPMNPALEDEGSK